ncbi:hypothetical protein Tco_1227399 [Tanacetum coccineum]
MREMIVNRNAKFAAFENEIHTLKLRLSKNMEDNKTMTTTMDVLKKETKEKEDKYIEEIVDLEKQKKDLDNIVYKVAQQLQPVLYDGTILAKKYDVISVIDSEETLILAEETLILSEDSRSKMNEKQKDPILKEKKPVVQLILVKTDVPRELPTISLVKKSFQKLKSHLEIFDKVVKVRTKVTAHNEGTRGFEHIRKAFEQDVIPFMKSLRESFQDFDNGLHTEINEMKAVFNQMESEIEQYLVHTVVNSYASIVDYVNMEKSYLDEYNKCLELKAELSKKNEMVEKAVYNELVIAPGMYKLDLPPLSSTLRKNKEVHEDYLKVTKEHADTLYRIVEHARALEPFDNSLDYAYSKKQVAAKTKNRNRRVTSEDNCDTSATKTQKQVESQSKQTTNKPLLPSTGAISSTSASGSKFKSNTRKNRITQAASSNQKNKKVEDHYRSVMSSSNKRNCVSICNARTKHAVLDANSKFVCSACNDYLFSANNDKCVVAYLNDVNLRVKSKSGRRIKKEWKSTGKVFTSVGHRWLPTGRTFIIDGTKSPMTRITSTKVVPPRESIQTTVITKISSSSASNKKPKVTKSVSSSKELAF